MSAKALLEPILENGIKNTNFFEGRLLTGRDLQDQQIANRTRHQQLGRAIGAGVIEGLEVEVKSDGSEGSPPVLTVKQGLAITAKGDILELPQNEDIALTRTLKAIEGKGDLFYNCLEPPTASIPNGAGIYILVMSPASGFRERAPKSGLGDNGIVKGCGSRYNVEGVQFRLVELNPANLDSIAPDTRDNLLLNDLLSAANPATTSEPDRLSKLRNILAHLCFGTETLKNFPADPFALENGRSAYNNYSALDDLHRLELLNDCDVPLALFYWTLDGIAFLDLWSVRRRPVRRCLETIWSRIVSEILLAESEAALLQFQDQITALFLSGAGNVTAKDYFYLLPPAGIIPVQSKNSTQGYRYQIFFEGFTYRDPVYIDGATMASLIRNALLYWPIDTSSKELVWLYSVRQNQQAIDPSYTTSVQRYLLFATGHMPFAGSARFDLAHWDYSNYASVLE